MRTMDDYTNLTLSEFRKYHRGQNFNKFKEVILRMKIEGKTLKDDPEFICERPIDELPDSIFRPKMRKRTINMMKNDEGYEYIEDIILDYNLGHHNNFLSPMVKEAIEKLMKEETK